MELNILSVRDVDNLGAMIVIGVLITLLAMIIVVIIGGLDTRRWWIIALVGIITAVAMTAVMIAFPETYRYKKYKIEWRTPEEYEYIVHNYNVVNEDGRILEVKE